MLRIIDINDSRGAIVDAAFLARAERVHRQLRPRLPADYRATMERVFAGGGRLVVAARGDDVVGVAVYRVYENTCDGVNMYVDDLVTDEATRSTGVGHALMEHMQKIARASGCQAYRLDSGTHREQAHKFYFREGLTITAFRLSRKL
jgi:hypothetical protein